MTLQNDFDKIAPVYDLLAFVIFGGAIDKSQRCFLKEIPPRSKVLVIGGGSGMILSSLLDLNLDLTIVYVELSKKMIEKSKSRMEGRDHKTKFILGDYNDLIVDLKSNESGNFDVVITNFFLDVWDSHQLKCILHQTSDLMKDSGLWLCTDFHLEADVSALKRLVVKVMYVFFRLVCNLNGKSLLPFGAYFKDMGFKEIDNSFYYFGMIKTSVYKKL